MKKFLALCLSLAMVLALGVTAFAAKTVNVGDGTGSITLENGTTGEKYQLYRVFDASISNINEETHEAENVSYTITATEANAAYITALQAESSPFTLHQIPNSDPAVYGVTRKDSVQDKDLLAWVETNVVGKDYLKVGAEIELAAPDNQAILWDNLAYGYYLITTTLKDKDTSKAAVTIDSNIPDVTVIDKNQIPKFEKKIVEKNDKGEDIEVDVNEATLNENVDFKIKLQAKNYDGEDKIFKYMITDTLDAGMTYTQGTSDAVGNVAVTVDGKPPVQAPTIRYLDGSNNVVTDITKATHFEIIMNWTNDGTKAGEHLYPANAEVVVTYQAYLDPEKPVDVGGTTTPDDGNMNTADVKYWKGTDTPDSTTPSGDLPDDKTWTFTTELTIQKTDEKGKALEGAEFTLEGPTGSVNIVKTATFTEATDGKYYLLEDGTYTKEAPNGDATHDALYADTSKKYTMTTTVVVKGKDQTEATIKATVGEDGQVTFTGLTQGDYILKESVVPNGYNPIDDIHFTIGFTPTGSDLNYTVAYDVSGADKDKITLEADNTLMATIQNQKGIELPSTGGIGTTIFYVVGGLMVAVAGVMLITKKRMSREG